MYASIFRNLSAGLVEGANRAESGHIIKGQKCGKVATTVKQRPRGFMAASVAGRRLTDFNDQLGVQLQARLLGKFTDSSPPPATVHDLFWTLDKSDMAVAQSVQVLDGGPSSRLVMNYDGVHESVRGFLADDDGRNLAQHKSFQ